MTPNAYLALGDSYTIGEGVPLKSNFPNQLVKLLNDKGYSFASPEIVAKTGWTTEELLEGIKKAGLEDKTFDLVTLLIGVNNQYREWSLDKYRDEFRLLLDQAIAFAGGDSQKVFVLSIPDWSVSPFGQQHSKSGEKIAREIDAYNQAKKEISNESNVHFVEITTHYREVGHFPKMVVKDQLHPGTDVYLFWAKKLADLVARQLE
ncbi:SGNH/GDSL hydrolase family protein [Echinicola jeungdonensis]|uniref:SGNH/GDSL hydrolase family protein n=1 Tax=Echinicola jeungdonensis TaxID=709343 RepID=A0ABV5J966_9BACT|nr:SGNH/GDSL hydrolase family protein [Echinicola jeungdonensis]MDN3669903.1 SGNH/GDSL hydrolase family protein [Echinicola jeungdonensis]